MVEDSEFELKRVDSMGPHKSMFDRIESRSNFSEAEIKEKRIVDSKTTTLGDVVNNASTKRLVYW